MKIWITHGHVKFVSEGKYPVFDSTFLTGDSSSNIIYMMNRDTIIQYDYSKAQILTSMPLSKTSLPPPFNKQIDCIIANQPNDNTIIMTRGQFWVQTSRDFTTIIGGPGVIGTGVLPLKTSPFQQGLNATVQAPDGTRYFFKNQNFLQTNIAMDKVLQTGFLGTGDFAGLPKSFSRIHAAFPSSSNIALVSYDKLVFYNTSSKSIIEGPVNLLTDSRFVGLPISFKVGITKPAVPFLNHTKFDGQRLRNFDISVINAKGVPGWNPSSFTKANTDTVFNIVSPPIKTNALLDLYPNVAGTIGTDTNLLLQAYEKNTAGWKVPTFGGNTVSFVLTNKSSSSLISYDDTGIGYNNAQMNPGEWLLLSVWARTEDTGLSVGAVIGSPATLSTGNINLLPLRISATQGWQLLTWEFHNHSKSQAKDINFLFSQDTKADTIHSFYGPVLKAKLPTVSNDFINRIIELPYFYLLNIAAKTKLGFDGSKAYSCSTCQTINGESGLNERLCAYASKTPGCILLGFYAQSSNINLGCGFDYVVFDFFPK